VVYRLDRKIDYKPLHEAKFYPSRKSVFIAATDVAVCCKNNATTE